MNQTSFPNNFLFLNCILGKGLIYSCLKLNTRNRLVNFKMFVNILSNLYLSFNFNRLQFFYNTKPLFTYCIYMVMYNHVYSTSIFNGRRKISNVSETSGLMSEYDQDSLMFDASWSQMLLCWKYCQWNISADESRVSSAVGRNLMSTVILKAWNKSEVFPGVRIRFHTG